MSILDDILGGARVTGEQHDTGRINFGTDGDIDAALRATVPGLWDAAEYGITREQAAAQLAAANTPEARAMVIQSLKERALRRAGLDTTGGRVRAFFAGKPAWHGLGVVVDRAATSAEAIKFAGLDWPVVKLPMSYTVNGQTFESAETFAIARGDTGAQLGTVGSRYAPVQNAEGFDFLDGVLQEFGARYETAGSIYGGARVWMLAHMPQHKFEPQAGDTIEPYVMFSNCHDGSAAAWCFPTTVRVECANTLRIATNRKAKALSIRHTGNVKDKISAARDVLGLAVKSVERFSETAQRMVNTDCDPVAYAGPILDHVLGMADARALAASGDVLGGMDLADGIAADFAAKALDAKQTKRATMLADIMDRYESDRCHPAGSVWAAFNAVTEHADHSNGGRKVGTPEYRASRRFESILTGEADTLKQTAYQSAVSLLAV